MAIEIKGLKVTACHGVLPEEKSNPQLFEFDIKIECDVLAAALSDDVKDTADYAKICTLVSDYCKKHSFNLIERLAYGAAYEVVGAFNNITAAEVTVHKPQAPIGLPFGDVCVTARVERNTVILSLGSSMGDKESTLDGAVEALKKVGGVKVLKVSSYHKSAAYGGVAQNEFLNCAVQIECLLTPRALLKEINAIEDGFGRVRKERWGDRTLDIDIVFFGNKIIEEEGLCIPHPDYSSRPFVIIPVKEIAPGLVCPLLHKRISDL